MQYPIALPVLLLALLVALGHSITVTMQKTNIIIPVNSNHSMQLNVTQSESQVNPLRIYLTHHINNSLAGMNEYFDYFKYMSPEDLECYQWAVGNYSYLYPCPFLENNDTILRANFVQDNTKDTAFTPRGFRNRREKFVIDNTPYPFPNGAYPYVELHMTATMNLTVYFNDRYQKAGISLIFINLTLVAIYGCVIGVLAYKISAIHREMLETAPESIRERRPSQIVPAGSIKEEEEESEFDNYQQMLGEFSENHKLPSLLSNSDENSIVRLIRDDRSQIGHEVEETIA